MNFDFPKTISLIKGGLIDHEATWNTYLAEDRGWQETAIALTAPLLVANVVLGLIFSRLIGGYASYGQNHNFFVALIIALILTAVGFVIAVLVFNFLASVFGGTANFSRAFAAVSLAAIPAWIAGIFAGLIPGIGFLIALAGGIMSLVFLYKIMPLALGVPGAKRVLHFIASIIAIVIINMVLGALFAGNEIKQGWDSQATGSSDSRNSSGMLGEMERQGRLMQEAGDDVYNPPADGKLTEDQVEAYVAVQRKTKVILEEYLEQAASVSADLEAKKEAGETPSASDLSKIYSGVGVSMSVNNAEMEVVLTGDGNWAEHQWVKQQLRIARIQQGEGNDANEHNYELYQAYEDELDQ